MAPRGGAGIVAASGPGGGPWGILGAPLTAGTTPVSDPAPSRRDRGTDRGPSAGARDRRGVSTEARDKRGLFERLIEFVSPGPDSKDELIRTLADAEQRELIEPESRLMLEGVLRMADLTAGDVMVPATRMDLLSIDAPVEDILATVIDTAHSRFPVHEGGRENIIGILLAKDLLKLHRAPELNLRALLRPAVFVPESKRLNELLRDFRSNRNHLAVVIDEFGNTLPPALFQRLNSPPAPRRSPLFSFFSSVDFCSAPAPQL